MRAERDLARAQAEAAQRQRHAFLSALAHDLRNPLAPLSNGIELLRLADNDPAGRLRTRGIMERQVANLMRIADELSDLARLSGDHANLQSTPFDLGALLQSLAERLAPTLHAQEMTLAIGPELLELPPLRGDAQRLSQAFGHLVADLARHAERGSTVQLSGTVEEGRVAVLVATAADADDEVTAALEDVEAAKLGLGVSLADQLVALHDGHLQAQRPAGARRARFTVTLPLDEPLRRSRARRRKPACATRCCPCCWPTTTSTSRTASARCSSCWDIASRSSTTDWRRSRPSWPRHPTSPSSTSACPRSMAWRRCAACAARATRSGCCWWPSAAAAAPRIARARAEAGFDRYLVKPIAMQDVRDALDAAQAVRSGASERAPGGFAPVARGLKPRRAAPAKRAPGRRAWPLPPGLVGPGRRRPGQPGRPSCRKVNGARSAGLAGRSSMNKARLERALKR